MCEQTIVYPSQEACDAFWESWEENGDTHKHGYYEATWMAVRAYMAAADEERRRVRNQ